MFALSCLASAILSSCSSQPHLPQGAAAALTAHWQALPSATVLEHHIIRAWPSAAIATDLTPWSPSMETWCVETVMTPAVEGSTGDETLLWIVFRESEGEPWSAALLATMSSTWPYEACGVAP